MHNWLLLIFIGISTIALNVKGGETSLVVQSQGPTDLNESLLLGTEEDNQDVSQPDDDTTMSIENDLSVPSEDTESSGFEDVSDSEEEKPSQEPTPKIENYIDSGVQPDLSKEPPDDSEFVEPEDEVPMDAKLDLPIEKSQTNTANKAPDQSPEGTVIVDPSKAVYIDYKNQKAVTIPYSQRRKQWGKFIGLSVGQPRPENFLSEFLTDDYENIYGDDGSMLIEVHTNFKRNYESLSLGFEFNIGNYNKSSSELLDSKLNVTYWKMGSQLALDNIFKDQSYVVPYISGGIYQIIYKETQSSFSDNGTTLVSLYGCGGVMFSINWVDPISAKDAYFESGVENTFIFAEATYFMESQEESDPDFSGLNINAGIKAEF